MGAESSQSTNDVGDVTTEDAPHRVEFIDHHVFESVQEVVPVVVGGEHPGMQHVRVGEDDVGIAAHPGAFFG